MPVSPNEEVVIDHRHMILGKLDVELDVRGA